MASAEWDVSNLDEGDFLAHDIVDFGFLELVRLGVQMPADSSVATSIAPTAAGSDGNGSVQEIMSNGDIYFHRYNHDNYGEANAGCGGWQLHEPSPTKRFFGRLWPVLSGERGEYELANGRSPSLYLQSMADAANDGYFVPEQIWDRQDPACFGWGRPTGSAAPLNWAEGQYLRLARSMDAGYNVDTPSVVAAKYRGAGPILSERGKCIDDTGANTSDGNPIEVASCNATGAQGWTWNSNDGTLRALGKCMDVAGGSTSNGTKVQLWDCNGTGAQQWRWRQQSRLVNPQSGRCLSVAGDTVPLQIADCNDALGQDWHIP